MKNRFPFHVGDLNDGCGVLVKVPDKLRHHFPEFAENVWKTYEMLSEHPRATAIEIGEALGISDRMVRKHLASLKEAGPIIHRGSNKAGYWEVLSRRPSSLL